MPFPMPQSRRSTLWIFTILLIIIGSIWVFLSQKSTSKSQEETVKNNETTPLQVTVKKARDLKSTSTEDHLPGVIIPENETTLLATTSGTISSAPFEVGSTVALGSVLFRIDTPFGSAVSKDGLPSETIRQAEIAVSLANKAYKDAERLTEKDRTKSVANTLARNLAKLRLESATIALDNARNSALVRATLSGIISKKNVSTGSAVSPGTTLATIASGTAPKIRFQVSTDTRQTLALGDTITVTSGNISSEAHITSLGAIADSGTGKFPIEAKLSDKSLRAGSIATVTLKTESALTNVSTFSLPLSAITTGQDGSFFFVEEDGKAKKVIATSVTVSGETGIVSADIPDDTNIIIESGRTLEEGAAVSTEK